MKRPTPDRSLGGLALWMALTAALSGCRDATPPPNARHLVLVTVDTLRADHVGVYRTGIYKPPSDDDVTPNMDRLARQGALFINASTHVPLTRPAHVSLFSGLLPLETGVRDNVSAATVPEVPTLAETLQRAGFRTGAFVSSVVLSGESGLDRGFDVYSDELEGEVTDPAFLNRAQKRGDLALEEATAWLESQPAGARTFLWLHLYDPHEPYEPPEPYASRWPDRPYTGEVAWADELIGRLDESLSRLGRVDDTLLVVTSDHGEGLGEHDELLHGFFAYETTLRIPLILRGPGIPPGSGTATRAGLVDLYPTLLDLVGIDRPEGHALSGRSHAQELRGGDAPEDAPLYAETLVPSLRFGWSDLRTIRYGRWKYIRAPRPELYDTNRDPGELDNVIDSHRREAGELDRILDSFLAGEVAATSESLPAEVLQQLGALGYLGGSLSGGESAGADPKDKIQEFRIVNDLMRRGLRRLNDGDYGNSAARFFELLERGIDSPEVRLDLGRALIGLSRFREAAEQFEAAVSQAPTRPGAWLGLAQARSRSGQLDEALEALRDGQGPLPRQASLRREEARLLRQLGRSAEAIAALESALPLAPKDPHLRAALAEILRDTGQLEEAAARFGEATEIEPDNASYWNALGMTLGGSGDMAAAERAFRQAWRLDSSNHHHAFNLALAILRQGRPAEARLLLERALELQPGFEPARRELARARGAL